MFFLLSTLAIVSASIYHIEEISVSVPRLDVFSESDITLLQILLNGQVYPMPYIHHTMHDSNQAFWSTPWSFNTTSPAHIVLHLQETDDLFHDPLPSLSFTLPQDQTIATAHQHTTSGTITYHVQLPPTSTPTSAHEERLDTSSDHDTDLLPFLLCALLLVLLVSLYVLYRWRYYRLRSVAQAEVYIPPKQPTSTASI